MRVPATLFVVAIVLGAAPGAAAGDAWVWPLEGRVLTPYANDDARPYAGGMHRGIDIAGAVGTAVVAARAGTVTHAGVVGSSGLTVAVRTEDGRYATSYLHLSTSAVKRGDAVAAGAPIGAVGTSGRGSVAAPHLHFGVRLAEADDRYVDPLSLLPPRAGPRAPAALPVPAPAPPRAAPAPVPIPVAAAPRVRGRMPVRVPARRRPRGAVDPGPAPARVPAAVLLARPARRTAPAQPRPRHVPAAPAPLRAGAPAGRPAARRAPVTAGPEPRSGPGGRLVLGGLGLIALALFGSLARRALGRARTHLNAQAAAAGAAIRAACPGSRSRGGPKPGRRMEDRAIAGTGGWP